jgi:uracil-DNA glycosylase family 4
VPLDSLQERAKDCRMCHLREGATQVVTWENHIKLPKIMFIGEAAGVQEDKTGIPFQGAAGKMLDKILESLNLERGKDVHITNIVKCRPPKNRTPTPNERKNCASLILEEEIKIIKPKAILCLGLTSAQYFLGEDKKMSELRGKDYDYMNIPVGVTYHPAYLIYNQGQRLQIKRKVLEDIQGLLNRADL